MDFIRSLKRLVGCVAAILRLAEDFDSTVGDIGDPIVGDPRAGIHFGLLTAVVRQARFGDLDEQEDVVGTRMCRAVFLANGPNDVGFGSTVAIGNANGRLDPYSNPVLWPAFEAPFIQNRNRVGMRLVGGAHFPQFSVDQFNPWTSQAAFKGAGGDHSFVFGKRNSRGDAHAGSSFRLMT